MGEVHRAEGGTHLFCSGSDGLSPKEFGNLRLIDLTLSNSENKFDELLIVNFDRLAIEFEKDQGRFQTNSFVAVNEGGGSEQDGTGRQLPFERCRYAGTVRQRLPQAGRWQTAADRYSAILHCRHSS